MWIKRRGWFWIVDGANVEEHIVSKQGRLTLVNWGSCLTGDIEIGEGVLISMNVTITSAHHSIAKDRYIKDQATIQKKIVIGDDVWIGAGAIVLGGNRIGTGAVIGAGAVLTEDHVIGDYEIWAGNPARFIKRREYEKAGG